jgi:opacity protein-like surface antigen
MTRAIVMIAAALAAATPAQARAQAEQPVPAPPPTTTQPPAPAPATPPPAQPAPAQEKQSALGFSLQGQIGAGQTTGDLKTDTDLVYGAIVGLHFSGPLGLELDYQHAENDVSNTGGLATFKQDGLLGHVRFDILRRPVTPFIYAGVGWVHYKADASLLNETVDRMVIPAGAGVEFQVSAIVIGARGEYQWNTSEFHGNRIDYWKAVGTIGFKLQ